MAIYQPVNITPDLVDGPENGVVFKSVGGFIEVSWQVSGSSPLSAYRIEFFKNDADSTAGTDTGKVNVSPSFYPVASDGTESRFSVTLPYGSSGTYFSIAESDANKEGKLRITQYWGNGTGQKVVQRALSVFRVTEHTTVSVATPTEFGGVVDFSATVTLPNYATYGESSVLWKRWQIFRVDDSELVQDTGKVWGASPNTWTSGQLFPGQYYAVFTIATSNGEEIATTIDPFSVMENATETIGAIRAECDRENGAVRIIARSSEQIPGDVKNPVFDYPVTGTVFFLDDGYAKWNLPEFSNGMWGFLWEGKICFPPTFDSRLAFRAQQTDGYDYLIGFDHENSNVVTEPSISINFPNTHGRPTGWLRFAVVYASSTTIKVSVGVFDSSENYAWTGWTTFNVTQFPLRSVQFLPYASVRRFYTFYGYEGVLEIMNAAENGVLPDFNGAQAWLDVTGPNLNMDYFGDHYGGAIWRSEAGSSEALKIAAFNQWNSLGEQAEYLDYSAGNGKEYTYSIITQQLGMITPIIASATPITPCFWDWVLIDAEVSQSDNLGDFIVNKVFFFGKNFQSGSDSNGSGPSVYSTFTRFPVVMRDTQNRHSGVLSSLIGVMTGPGEYTDSNETRDLLRALSTSTNPLFLRSRRGDFFRVAISGEILTAVQDNSLKQPITASVPWVEIGPVTGSVMKNVTQRPLE